MSDIRQLATQEPRVETGPVQFGDDWPGVFIRGDNAFFYARGLERLIRETEDPISTLGFRGLQRILAGAVLGPVGERLRSRTKGSDLASKLRIIADFEDTQGNPDAASTCREAADLLERLAAAYPEEP